MNSFWPVAAETGILTEREVHVWCANLEPSANELATLQRTLTADEVERAGRFRFWRHERRYIAGRGILRVLLGRYLNIAPVDIEISYSDYNKPFLPDNKLRFNLSHSKDTGLFAFCLMADIGVDLEMIRPISDAEGIAARFFSTYEFAQFQSLPTAERDEAFFACWTRKEAFIKAIGEGLSYPLRDFDVTLAPGEKARLVTIGGSSAKANGWSLYSLVPVPGFTAAMAVLGQGWRLSQRQYETTTFGV